LGDDMTFVLNSSSAAPTGIWTNRYITLAYLNRVIYYADRIETEIPAEQVVLNRVRAEALTLRAYCHNQLLSYFSTNPKDMNALGVIVADRIFEPNTTGMRSTNGEVYTLIDSDLQEATDIYAAISEGAPDPFKANVNF